MRCNHRLRAALRRWPIRGFVVVEDSMRPTLNPGDGLLALRDDNPQRGQLRLFRHPAKSSQWLVKRVGDVYRGERSVTFEARSDNPNAPRAADSHDFGWVEATETYRVIWTARSGESR
ncbi:S26 family signal peptidase [Mycolicibacterium hippocampi]|nr:S26 family signal peptidase [Mycolicibacterium hippocampi]